MGKIIDGKRIAKELRENLRKKAEKLRKEKGIRPKLVVFLIGEDHASSIYVRNKEKACAEIGIESEVKKHQFIEEKRLIDEIRELNNNRNVHGILVQLPLPKEIDAKKVLHEISPEKDVDGLSIENMGRLLKGENPLFLACTPQGIMHLILSTGIKIEGKQAVVIGRSNIVGKPVAFLLLAENATVTICHSRTQDLADVCSRADILVAAVGKAKMVKKDWVKDGAVVIDVGMNREDGKLCGDVDFEAVKDKAGYITPVPGGVGPMTIAMLVKNTIDSAERLGI